MGVDYYKTQDKRGVLRKFTARVTNVLARVRDVIDVVTCRSRVVTQKWGRDKPKL